MDFGSFSTKENVSSLTCKFNRQLDVEVQTIKTGRMILMNVYKKFTFVLLCIMLIFPMGHVYSATAEETVQASELRADLGGIFGEYALLSGTFAFELLDQDENSEKYGELLKTFENNVDRIYMELERSMGTTHAVLYKVIWDNHIDAVIDYLLAINTDNLGNREGATLAMTSWEESILDYLESIQLPVDEEIARAGLEGLSDNLRSAILHYESGNYAEAYSNIRQAYRDMSQYGQHLANAIEEKYPEVYEEDPTPAASDYKLGWARLMGEHSYWVTSAMELRSQGDSAEANYQAILNVIQENTDDMADRMAFYYGYDTATEFEALWENHVAYMLNYADSLKENSASQPSSAYDDFNRNHEALTNFLSQLTPGVDVMLILDLQDGHSHDAAMATGYMHTERYDQAYFYMQQGYRDAFDTGYTLGENIVEDVH
jgi:tetratricopeptide (TPR) repeat protein